MKVLKCKWCGKLPNLEFCNDADIDIGGEWELEHLCEKDVCITIGHHSEDTVIEIWNNKFGDKEDE